MYVFNNYLCLLVKRAFKIVPFRLGLWWLFEKANYKGNKLFTLRQHRKWCRRINKCLLIEESYNASKLESPKEAEHLKAKGWCKVKYDEIELQLLVEELRSIATVKMKTMKKGSNPFGLEGMQVLKNNKSVMRLINSEIVTKLAYSYFGEKPFVRDIDILYSSVQEKLTGAQLLHLDNINEKALRLIMHIDDVQEDNGPFTFFDIQQTCEIEQLIHYYDRRDYNIIDDVEIDGVLKKHIPQRLLGKSGSLFFADTCQCLHFGSRVTKGHRLVMMATYTTKIPTNFRWLRAGEAEPLVELHSI